MYSILKKIWMTFSIAMLTFSAYYAESNQSESKIRSLNISIDSPDNTAQYLHQVIKNKISQSGIKIVGTRTNILLTKNIEDTLWGNPLLKKITVYKTWPGDLNIEIVAKKPIARIISDNASNMYIDEQGSLIPISKDYSFRVLILKIQKFKGVTPKGNISEYDSKLLKLLLFIHKDKFWKSQISLIEVDQQGNLIMSTQISKQNIVFGQPENIKSKFDKLKIFYEKIAPKKGWNAYKSVNIKFDKQIVCE